MSCIAESISFCANPAFFRDVGQKNSQKCENAHKVCKKPGPFAPPPLGRFFFIAGVLHGSGVDSALLLVGGWRDGCEV